jgi:hypothetical protein
VPIIFAKMSVPGRITFADIRYSRARLNNNVGESCSIARSRRNCSSSFIASLPAGAVFHSRYSAIFTRWSDRVCDRCPYNDNAPGSAPSRSASRATAAGGAEPTSSGTNPSHGNVHSWTSIPSRSAVPRPRPGSTNATSADVGVKNRINSSLLISGNDRSCSSCSSENIFSDKTPPQRPVPEKPDQNVAAMITNLHNAASSYITAGQRYIRWKFLHCYRDPYWRRPEIEGMPLLRARHVRRWITRLPEQYGPEHVAELAAAAERRFPPYLDPADPADPAANRG